MSPPEPCTRRAALPGRGGDMAWLDFGPQDRPVDVVFSHANGFNARTYRTVLAPLSDLRILAIDLRGHGRSALPTDGAAWSGWEGFGDDLLAFLDIAVEGPVVLGGHSMGATTSLLAAARRPAAVRALALFEPVLLPLDLLRPLTPGSAAPGSAQMETAALRRRALFPDRTAALAAYRGRGAFATWSAAELADYLVDAFMDTADGQVTLTCTPTWEASNYRNQNYDPWVALAEVTCPVRLLRSQKGSATYLDVRPDLLAQPNVQVETVAGATHFLPMERPDLVQAALRELAL